MMARPAPAVPEQSDPEIHHQQGTEAAREVGQPVVQPALEIDEPVRQGPEREKTGPSGNG